MNHPTTKYTLKIHDGEAVILNSDKEVLRLTLDGLREELDEASQRMPYDLAWMGVLQEGIDALLDA